jgi:4-hydroxybenzoate polyprenyltransferase
LQAAHPLPTLAVTAFVTATAVSAGLRGRAALLALAVVVGQLSVGWSNDAIDAPRDRRSGRRDKPIVAGTVRWSSVARGAGVALALDVPLSLLLGWRAGVAHLAAVTLAWSYNLRLKATPLSPLPYAGAFGLVPVVVAGTLPGAPSPRPALVGAAVCCGIAAHFANTVGDTAEDALTGVRGLPQRIGPGASVMVAAGFVAAAAALVVVGVGATGVAVAAVVVDGAGALAAPLLVRSARGRRTAFRLVLAAVAVLVVAFVVSGGSRLVAS